MNLKEEQDWLYELYSEKKQEMYDGIRSVVLNAENSTVKLKGREWEYTNLLGKLCRKKFIELYIDADYECIVKFADDKGEWESELWHFNIDEMYFMIDDMEV